MIKKSSGVKGHHRVRDFISYIFISFAAVMAVIVAALRGVPQSQIMYWVWMVLFTAAVFWQFVLKSKNLWKKKSFWIVCTLGFAIHLLVCTLLFHSGRQISGMQWVLLALVEVFILVIVRNRMFGPTVRA